MLAGKSMEREEAHSWHTYSTAVALGCRAGLCTSRKTRPRLTMGMGDARLFLLLLALLGEQLLAVSVPAWPSPSLHHPCSTPVPNAQRRSKRRSRQVIKEAVGAPRLGTQERHHLLVCWHGASPGCCGVHAGDAPCWAHLSTSHSRAAAEKFMQSDSSRRTGAGTCNQGTRVHNGTHRREEFTACTGAVNGINSNVWGYQYGDGSGYYNPG